MANCCCTDYVLEGPKTDLETIKEAIESVKEERYGLSRIHRVMESLGVAVTGIDLREDITGVKWSEGGESLLVQAESSWNPKLDAWREIRKKFPHVKVFFRTEEFGTDVFYSNDTQRKHFKGTVALDWAIGNDGGLQYFKDGDELVKWTNEKFQKEFGTFNEARTYLENDWVDESIDEDAFASIHILEYDDFALLGETEEGGE